MQQGTLVRLIRATVVLSALLAYSAPAAAQIVIGPGPGGNATVQFIEPSGTRTIEVFPGFLGGVSVTLGDINGDGSADVIVGAGPGGSPHVRVFSGTDLRELASFFAFDPAFTGGVHVAAGDLDGDGRADIIVGAGSGGSPHVRAFSGADLSVLASFWAYDPAFTGGVTVAAGDVNGDGRADIVTGAGPGGGPHVRVLSGFDLSELASFFAYDSAFEGGVSVAAGDVDGDGLADVITGAGAGGGPHVRVLSGLDLSELASFWAFDPAFGGGVGVAAGDIDGDGRADLVLGAGPGGGPHVRVLSGLDLGELASFFADGTGSGVSVGSLGDTPGLRFTSAAMTTFMAGSHGSFTVTTFGLPAPAITENGTLPAGVNFTDNGDGTATLAGTPSAGTGGTYALMFSAVNGSSTPVTQAFTLTVHEAPAFTSANATTLTGAGTFSVTTSGLPTPALTVTGTLPSGVSFVDNGNGTGTLAGPPAAGTSGTYPLTFSATNSIATSTQNFTLIVALPATKLVVTQVNGGVNPSAGAAFAVVVQAQDSAGPAAVTANTAVLLSRQTGTGTLGGTLTGTIISGSNSVTISGVTYTKAESGVSITAARTSGNALTSGTSASFTVNPGPLAGYLLTPSSTSFLAGVASLVTIQPQDAFGNPRTGAAAVTITGRNASDTANNANVQVDANRDGTYGDAVVNTAAGAATFNIANGVAESFTLRASDGAISGLSAAITTTPGSPVLITEFRFRGKAGLNDEYVNLYNNTDLPITVSTSDGSAGWALVAADGVVRVTIPNGTVLPARGYYLITNNGTNGFSLTSYPAGAGTVGSGDRQYTLDIPVSGVNAGVALFRSSVSFDLTTRLDAVGYSTVPALYREGTGMNSPAPNGGAEQLVNLQQAYIRNLATGLPKDTDDNRADFNPVDTNGTLTGNGQRVGMPGPRSSASPIRRTQILVSDIPSIPSTVRDTRSTDWNVPGGGIVTWPSGVVSLPRRFTNNTGQAVTRLRIRIVSMPTFPSPSGEWDLRPIDATGTVTNSAGTVIASGLRPMLLELPREQFNGGGINSTLTLDVSALPGGSLANGASVDVHLRIGVAQEGTNPFVLSFIVEALP